MLPTLPANNKATHLFNMLKYRKFQKVKMWRATDEIPLIAP